MEKKFLFVFIALSIFLFTLLILNKNVNAKYTDIEVKNHSLKDSMAKRDMDNHYITRLLMRNYSLGNVNLKQLEFYDILAGGAKKRISNLTGTKEKFVIRYSTIGCNTCINLIFKRKERIKAIEEKYDLIVLVDFVRYADYIKWKRVSELDSKIYWIQSGKLPFDSDFEGDSYSFILDKNMVAHSFFVPNNQFPEHLHDYLKRIVNIKDLDNSL